MSFSLPMFAELRSAKVFQADGELPEVDLSSVDHPAAVAGP